MSYISTQPPAADPRLQAMYESVTKSAGYWPNLYQVLSLRPAVLKPLADWERLVTFGGSSLGRRDEELLSFYVSYLNGCHY